MSNDSLYRQRRRGHHRAGGRFQVSFTVTPRQQGRTRILEPGAPVRSIRRQRRRGQRCQQRLHQYGRGGLVAAQGILPTLSINDVSVSEGGTGVTTPAVFTVTLSQASPNTVTVQYYTTNVSAVGGADRCADYLAIPSTSRGTLQFDPGQTSKTISVSVHGDAVPGPNETFVVQLEFPTNATLARAQGTGTIVSDDNTSPAGQTFLTCPTAAGATRLEVEDQSIFKVGDTVQIGTGPTAETNTVTGFGSLILSTPLVRAHAAGELVAKAGASTSVQSPPLQSPRRTSQTANARSPRRSVTSASGPTQPVSTITARRGMSSRCVVMRHRRAVHDVPEPDHVPYLVIGTRDGHRRLRLDQGGAGAVRRGEGR